MAFLISAFAGMTVAGGYSNIRTGKVMVTVAGWRLPPLTRISKVRDIVTVPLVPLFGMTRVVTVSTVPDWPLGLPLPLTR